MSKLTADLHSIRADLDAAEATAAKLAEGTSEAQANWQPNQGRGWSICQCLDHLARMNVVYATPMLEAVEMCDGEDRRPTNKIEPGWFEKRFIRSMEPLGGWRMKAPSKAMPASQGKLAALVSEFTNSHAIARALLQRGKGIDLNRVRFQNPFVRFLRFTVGTGLLVINAHDRRHLWQAEQVKTSEGYPAS